MFGIDLTEQVKNEGGQIPKIVVSCVEAVEKRGLDFEGIYRISGALTQANKLKDAFNNGWLVT